MTSSLTDNGSSSFQDDAENDELIDQLGLPLNLPNYQRRNLEGSKKIPDPHLHLSLCKALKVLRDCNESLTYVEIAQLAYPEAFTTRTTSVVDPYGKPLNISKKFEERYIKKIKAQIHKVDSNIHRQLALRSESRQSQLDYLQQVTLAIRIGEDQKGRAYLAYHGPDLPQPQHYLSQYLDWAIAYAEKSKQPSVLAEKLLSTSSNAKRSPQINNDDLPFDEDTTLLDFG